jgi:hypothetical protein
MNSPRSLFRSRVLFHILLFALGLDLAVAASEPMKIADTAGREMSVRLLSSDGTTVRVIRDSDGQTFALPLSRLNAASQAAVKTWLEKGGGLSQKFEIEVDTGKNRRKTGGEDFDDKRVNLSPKITVKNPNLDAEAQNGKVTVLIFGRPVQSNDDLQILGAQNFELARLKPGASSLFEMKEISQAYDNRGYAQFGSRYLGYVVLIHSPDGKTLYDFQAVPDSLGQHGLKLLKLKSGLTYDNNLIEKK